MPKDSSKTARVMLVKKKNPREDKEQTLQKDMQIYKEWREPRN